METLNVLYVDDNLADQRMMKEVFKTVSQGCHVDTATDAEEAISFIKGKNSYAEARHPDFVIVDLHLPRITGRDLLGRIKGNARLKHIPTMIITSSATDAEICSCYQAGATCCVRKPKDYNELRELIHPLTEFWQKKVWYCSKFHHEDGEEVDETAE